MASSHMVLVRLLSFLKLDKVTQISFAEYHSKGNFVERVHAEENRVLSKHGPFLSKPLHENASVGSKEHMQNIENVRMWQKKYDGRLYKVHLEDINFLVTEGHSSFLFFCHSTRKEKQTFLLKLTLQ